MKKLGKDDFDRALFQARKQQCQAIIDKLQHELNELTEKCETIDQLQGIVQILNDVMLAFIHSASKLLRN